MTSALLFSSPRNLGLRRTPLRSTPRVPAPLSVQSLGIGSDGDEFRRRQHLGETARARSLDAARPVDVLYVKGRAATSGR